MDKQSQSEKLKSIIEYFEIQNKSIAAALGVHPALISRWKNGTRTLKADSEHMERLVDFILTRDLSPQNIAWLKKMLRQDGIESEFSSISDIKLGLILWLSDDSSGSIRFVLDEIINDNSNGIVAAKYGQKHTPNVRLHKQDFVAKAGITEIGLQLEAMLKDSCCASMIDIHISGENSNTIMSKTIQEIINNSIENLGKYFRLILSVSNRSEAASRIMLSYLKYIINGTLIMYVTNEDKNSITEQTTIIPSWEDVVIITEILDSAAPMAALFVKEKRFIDDIKERFEKMLVYAQPVFNPLREISTRRVQKMYLEDYEKSGDVSIIRDGLSPLYMSQEGYDSLLKKLGYVGDALRWRSSAFKRMQEAMNESLEKGLEIREIISMECMERLIKNDEYQMSGDAVLDVGTISIDKGTLLSMLEGYFHYIQMYPNLHVRFSQNLDEMHRNIEWQLKENTHVIIKRKEDEIQPLLFSKQPVFVYAIQEYYEKLWREVNNHSMENNQQALAVLDHGIRLLKENI